MPAPITTQLLSPLMHRGFLELIETQQKEMPDHAAKMIGREINTNQLYEEMVYWSGLGAAAPIRELGGVPFDTPATPFTKRWYVLMRAIGVELSIDSRDADVSGKLKRPASMFAESHYLAEQYAAADLINFMTNTGTDYLGPDAFPLCSASHPTKGGGTTSNRLSGDSPFGPLALENIMLNGSQQKSWKNEPFQVMGPYVGISSEQLQPVVDRVRATQNWPGSNDNDKQVATARIMDWIFNPFITQKYYWGLIAKGGMAKNPLFKLTRRPLTIREAFNPHGPSDLIVSYKSYSFGWTRHYGFIGSAATS